MHRFAHEIPETDETPGTRTSFLFNSDLSGGVDVVHMDTEGGVENITIPGAAIVGFVAELVRRQRINSLEEASDFEVLGLEVPIISVGQPE